MIHWRWLSLYAVDCEPGDSRSESTLPYAFGMNAHARADRQISERLLRTKASSS